MKLLKNQHILKLRSVSSSLCYYNSMQFEWSIYFIFPIFMSILMKPWVDWRTIPSLRSWLITLWTINRIIFISPIHLDMISTTFLPLSTIQQPSKILSFLTNFNPFGTLFVFVDLWFSLFFTVSFEGFITILFYSRTTSRILFNSTQLQRLWKWTLFNILRIATRVLLPLIPIQMETRCLSIRLSTCFLFHRVQQFIPIHHWTPLIFLPVHLKWMCCILKPITMKIIWWPKCCLLTISFPDIANSSITIRILGQTIR